MPKLHQCQTSQRQKCRGDIAPNYDTIIERTVGSGFPSKAVGFSERIAQLLVQCNCVNAPNIVKCRQLDQEVMN